MNTKRFHKSDSLIYTYNVIEYPYEGIKEPNFTRHCKRLHASNGVKWQDVVEEIHSLRKNPTYSSSPILTTVMVDYPDFVVALTLTGFLNIINSLLESSSKINNTPREYIYFNQVDDFAKEMVALRDEAEYERSLPKGYAMDKSPSDFWPK